MKEKIVNILNKFTVVPSNQTKLSELGLDSLDVSEAVINLETEFKVSISDDDFLSFTVDELADYIAKQ